MNIIDFKQCNVIYGANQPEYLPLPAHKAKDGTVTSCWEMTPWERLKVLFTGRIYLQLLTFNTPVQPQLLTTDNPVKED